MKQRVLKAFLSLSIGFSVFTYTSAHAQSLSDIHKKQAENDTKKQKKNAEIKEVQGQQDQVVQELEKIESNLEQTKKDIETKKTEIDDTKKEIDRLKDEIAKIQKRIEERDALLKERVRSMYESGGAVKYLEVVLGSQNFGDFLDRLISLNMIAESDKALLEEQKRDKAKVEENKKDVEQKLESLNAKLQDLNGLNDKLKAQKEAKDRLSASLKKKETHLHEDVTSIEEKNDILAAQEKAIKEEIARAKREAEQRKREEAARKAAAEKAAQKQAAEKRVAEKENRQAPAPAPAPKQSTPHVSANFIWPANGYVSSPFGTRFGGSDFHPGIDIAEAGAGNPIVAAADGTVARSYLSSSYGNCVFVSSYIDGQLYTTVYAHMSERMVSTGQTVKQGQRLGTMGNTGHSTGQHLHFELHKGQWNYAKSNAVNPVPYLH
ncbi:murein hydrolase activator EnvC family protein [Fictibacillus sp. S7]|uniref:murein hydrolase activator EnvC family protein n=1 Tax=Fictibacillus sp. S7 TaxID=2212476 RepID=UPI0010130EB4|nr:M23 family metallopeptidase [Fictibacillus sp. S7]RXZ01894.1 peptidase M23 [Fictibacillus sp. S7]